MEKRQHVRVPAQFRSHFSRKSPVVAGDGELLDLSPGGCRVTSHTAVSSELQLELCIFPGDEGNPIIVDAATVQWIDGQQFGLAFTQIRPVAQRQLMQLWRKRAPLN